MRSLFRSGKDIILRVAFFPSPRLRLERTQHYVEAFVERSNGNVVLSASTREWAIKKHLYSPTGVTACRNLGRVMAQRCLEAGINFVNFKAVIPWEHRCDSASTCLLIFNLPFFPFLNTDLCFCTISAFLCGLTVQRVTLTSYTLCVCSDIWVLTACSLFTSLSSHQDPGIWKSDDGGWCRSAGAEENLPIKWRLLGQLPRNSTRFLRCGSGHSEGLEMEGVGTWHLIIKYL